MCCSSATGTHIYTALDGLPSSFFFFFFFLNDRGIYFSVTPSPSLTLSHPSGCERSQQTSTHRKKEEEEELGK
jgi:hypothetical protein